MYWQKRFDIPSSDADLEVKISTIRKNNKDYGYRRIWGKLRENGVLVNCKRVQRLVQKLGLQVTSFTRRSRKYNSYKGTVGRVAPNRLRRRFDTCVAHQKITTDTTELKYYEMDAKGNVTTRKAYLDPFLDLFNREIISFSFTKCPSSQGILSALEKAIDVTRDCPYRRTFHSDQGWAYQMKEYQRLLKNNNIFQSMSRKGNCMDNGAMENFFGRLKVEMFYGEKFENVNVFIDELKRYIDYYNYERISMKLKGMSPVQYRTHSVTT